MSELLFRSVFLFYGIEREDVTNPEANCIGTFISPWRLCALSDVGMFAIYPLVTCNPVIPKISSNVCVYDLLVLKRSNYENFPGVSAPLQLPEIAQVSGLIAQIRMDRVVVRNEQKKLVDYALLKRVTNFLHRRLSCFPEVYVPDHYYARADSIETRLIELNTL